ncbi:MAG: hypothetical protein HC822_22740 [Oscillochloris sp.]|nr:hypothetical protein [Oscillochloris sp.]
MHQDGSIRPVDALTREDGSIRPVDALTREVVRARSESQGEIMCYHLPETSTLARTAANVV